MLARAQAALWLSLGQAVRSAGLLAAQPAGLVFWRRVQIGQLAPGVPAKAALPADLRSASLLGQLTRAFQILGIPVWLVGKVDVAAAPPWRARAAVVPGRTPRPGKLVVFGRAGGRR